MKIILKGVLVVFLTLTFTPSSWGFGPPGPGKIPNPLLFLQRGFPVFQNVTTPFSYPSLRHLDILELIEANEIIEVEGKSSALFIYFPFSFRGALDPTSGFKVEFGDRGIAQAISDAKDRYQVDYVFDVRIDLNIVTYLILYNKITTVIHAKGIRLQPDRPGEKKP
ncbi:MAG TPA: hypothetical protein VGB26_04370 [Nitrospiria bacterium]|jgi:hypothetical protein